MELNNSIEKFNNISDKWKEHIQKEMQERLKKAMTNIDNDNLKIIEIGDMGAIDSIEDEIVRCELLDGNMIEIPKKNFKYDIEEGDIINLKLTYKEGRLEKIDILNKNNEEKLLRIQMMKEKMKQIKRK